MERYFEVVSQSSNTYASRKQKFSLSFYWHFQFMQVDKNHGGLLWSNTLFSRAHYFLGIISSYWARLYKYVYGLFQLTEPLWQKKYNYWKWEISNYFYTSGSTLLWNIFCEFCSDWKNNFSFTVYSDLCYTTTIFFAFVTPLVFKLNFWFQVFMWTFVRTGPIVVDWDINKLYATFGKLGLVWGGELSKITLLGLNYSIALWPIWAYITWKALAGQIQLLGRVSHLFGYRYKMWILWKEETNKHLFFLFFFTNVSTLQEYKPIIQFSWNPRM